MLHIQINIYVDIYTYIFLGVKVTNATHAIFIPAMHRVEECLQQAEVGLAGPQTLYIYILNQHQLQRLSVFQSFCLSTCTSVSLSVRLYENLDLSLYNSWSYQI